MMVQAPAFNRAGRAWRDFAFTGLEKVSRTQVILAKRLEWLLPGIAASGEVSDGVRARLKQLFDDEVRMVQDYVHVIPPKALKKYVSDPTFLAVLAPMPHKTRGFLEVELGLAHAAIDMLLGGAGETVALRPLTDIEQGVMSYLIIETLKALAPSVDPGLPRLRLEGLCHGVDEALQLLGEEQQVAVVQLKAVIGAHSGYLRLFIPSSVLGMTNPPADGPERRVKLASQMRANASRLSGVKTWLRAEIGHAEISNAELAELRDRDVVLVDQLTARPDKGEGGHAQLRVGAGRVGCAQAEVLIEGGRLKAKITGFSYGEQPKQGREPDEAGVAEPAPAASAEGAGEEVDGPALAEDADNEESTNPSLARGGRQVEESTLNEGAELLNDIPLQIAIELARVPVSAEEVVSLKVGQVIDLNRVPGEPVELSVNGKVVARGELVEVEGHLGVRVLSLAG
ncbi:MAG: type III secretion system cytoplasmic ring protein SctQ [Myxococcaceae bacterium]